MIDREIFQQCLPVLGSPQPRIMLSLVNRLRAADNKIESLALLNGKERTFEFLKKSLSRMTKFTESCREECQLLR